jgi:methionyl-tRNA formyltransferase
VSKNLLFIGYGRERTRLIDLPKKFGWNVEQTDKKVEDFSDYDLVISYGYRHISKANVLATAKRPVLNLHIASLPWNRGAHPLFWAAYDGTPFGVTIHEVDSGIDTGPICFQKNVDINQQRETFASGYKLLTDEIEELFEANANELLNGNYISRPQEGSGSFKRVKDLPSGFEWSEVIFPAIYRLKQVADA